MTNQEIKDTGLLIKNEQQIGGNTALRVGGVIEGIGVAFDNKDAANGYYQATINGGSISVNAPNFVLGTGGNLRIKMPAAGTTASTLTIGNANAVQLWYNGTAVSSDNTWEADEIISVFYDGTRFMASNAQGGGGKAEKIKYDNSQSGLAAENVQGALDVVAENISINDELRVSNGFQIATNRASTVWYTTSLGFVKGKKYKISVKASATYSNVTSFILQVVSQQFEGQKNIGVLPANTSSVEFDYLCTNDELQYACIYASGSHTVTYSVIIYEYLDIADVVDEHESIVTQSPTYVNFYMSSAYVIASSNTTKSKYYNVVGGQQVRVKANSHRSSYIYLLKSLPETLTNNQDLSSYAVCKFAIPNGTEQIIDIPSSATIMWVDMTTYYQGTFLNYDPAYIVTVKGEYGYEDISDSNDWIIKDGVFFSGVNGKYVLNANSAFKYIPVQEGEKYIIVANSRGVCNYALMQSIPETITHWDDISATSYGMINSEKSSTLTIDSGCNYLAVAIKNVGINLEPIYVGKYSSSFLINNNIALNGALINNVDTKRVLMFPVYGQSLAIGGDALRITTYCRFPKNCVNTNGNALLFDQPMSSSSQILENSSFGLIESYIDFKSQEDGIPSARQTDCIATCVVGQGSSYISQFVKDETLYNDLLAAITTAYNNRRGKEFVVPAFCWIQGEADRSNGIEYYYNTLSQLREDLDADIKAITGQTEDVHCIIYQTNQLCPAAGSSYNPNSYSSGANGAYMESVIAQWQLIKDSQYFHASSPVYPMDFVVSPNDAIIHISSTSQKYLGYYEGLAAKRLMDGHGDDLGLYVTNVTKVDTTHIRLSLHVPAPPVVIDTESVYEVANYGFSVITENNENVISSVEIERNNLDATTILITTSADCTNAKVRYGVNGTIGYSGFDKGPRGNIRDSQGLWYKAVINNRKVPMHNWLYFFEETLS